jgi:mannose-1-phosphate guanylyltransferase
MSRAARAATARQPAPGRLHAVVLAGGAGERFWPASRVAFPKPLLRVAGGGSLLAATLARARALAPAPAERVWLVCGGEHAAAMRRESRLPARRVIVEPARRNTAMAVAVAALAASAVDPDAVLAVFPADHRIADPRGLGVAVRRAARAATAEGVLVTLGVRPTRPDTGYGYIGIGAAANKAHPGLHRVRRFVEKPDAARARRFLASGDFLWNAGIFVWSARAILEEIAAHAPEIDAALRPLRRSLRAGRGLAPGALARAYRAAPALPVDVAVLERSRRVWCLPVTFPWSDVGTWQSLAEALGVNRHRSAVVEGEVVLCDAPGNLVWGQGRPIALLGVEGLAVVDAGDALLVARLDRSGDVRDVVRELRARGRHDLV